jgi:CTP synthase
VDLSDWQKIVDTIKHPKGTLTIGVIGKYVTHQDAYKSVFEALHHGAIAAGYRLVIKSFEADKLMNDPASIEHIVKGLDGCLVPGGFGERGWMGKITTAKHCRENKIPFFGICLGMQVMVTEFARHVLGWDAANSTEIDPSTPHPVISLLSEQEHVIDMGGTMRLGAYACTLKSDSKAFQIYGKKHISERHRHRYEFNNKYIDVLEKAGLVVSGKLEEGNLCEITEVKNHPWMIGVQFHPEFKSKPTEPHPLFRSFVEAAIERQQSQRA